MKWMIYGANGYTGELAAERAVARGMKPVLAGRRAEAVKPIAERLGLEWKAFALDRAADELAGFAAVLLCAGPFSATSAPVVDACLTTKTHYLDITGEISVFEACHARDEQAKSAGIVVMPGVGFDVVPSDCLAASLKAALPDATELELAFASDGRPSRGTAKTMVENLGKGGAIRKGGQIVPVKTAYQTAEIPFRDGTRTCVTIPWGDVSTAWYSTHIPNIAVYMAMPPKQIRAIKLARPFLPLMELGPVQRFLKSRVDRGPAGPDENMRKSARVQLWGRVKNAGGRTIEGTLETPEGYSLTAEAAVECMRRVLDGKAQPGTLTPSMAFGGRFVTELAGCDLRVPA